jgi:hypothetical protein
MRVIRAAAAATAVDERQAATRRRAPIHPDQVTACPVILDRLHGT